MTSTYSSLISIDNLFQAWDEFKKGKRAKKDVQVFERNLEDNLFALHQKLKSKTYRHGNYQDFYVNDPKRRHIHKADVQSRVIHHLLYKYLYELFDKTFIYDSYSCRLGKGTHKAVKRLEKFATNICQNYKDKFWVLKMDIMKFFASVDHDILNNLISKKVKDKDVLWLTAQIIGSFPLGVRPLMGIPLGNLTSQIFANIYLNELDQFVKHNLKIKYYLRYADDFIILDPDRENLCSQVDPIRQFLAKNLKLGLHPDKITLRKLRQGIDFCGYVVLPHYLLPRDKTKRRIVKKVTQESVSSQAFMSYLGYFSHAKSYKIQQELKNIYFFNNENF